MGDTDAAEIDEGPGDDIAAVLHKVAASLPGGGEDRPGQLAMAKAVQRAFEENRHLVVQAGTGTGKSLAYLLPLVQSGRKAVVATATKALQDQLADKDLPLLAGAAGDRRRITFAVLKGRSNYLCRQRASEVRGRAAEPSGQPARAALFDAEAPSSQDARTSDAPMQDVTGSAAANGGRFAEQVLRLIAWADSTDTGDRADLDFEPHHRAWSTVSVTARECPGAFRCPSGPDCFAEHARTRAAAADVVVVNTHLYATHVASDGAVLPEHDLLVLDEAHEVEDVMSAGLGVEISPSRLRAAAQAARGFMAADDVHLGEGVADVADQLERALRPLEGQRVLQTGAGNALSTLL
ncbi:MAG: ATP-dependent DNA helicase, partial [Acidimicrobiales bacterium]